MPVPIKRRLLSLFEADRPLAILIAVLAAALCNPSVQAQAPRPNAAAKSDPFIAAMTRWDSNHDGVLTCDEWRQYLNRLFTLADKNHDGFLDRAEFQHIQKLEPIFADADMSYFDDNHDRRISRAEFVDKPSPFFARYDTNHDCRVTSQELSGNSGGDPPRGGPGGGSPGGMGGGGRF